MGAAQDQLLETIMGLIMHGGDAKSSAFEAIYAAKAGNFEEAESKVQEANIALQNAHQSQTRLLTQEANGEDVEISLLLVHGQDHLMNAITFIDLAKEIIDIHRKLEEKND